MTICFAKNLVLVFSVCLYILCNADKHSGINCNLNAPFTSASVTPLIEHSAKVTGCFAATQDQEIHVLNLLKHSIEGKENPVPTISLEIQSHWKEKPPESIIIILLSLSPVVWKIKLPVSGNSTDFHVIVNKPAHAVPNIQVPVSRRKLPPVKKLSSWIENHYGRVTSYSAVPVANQVKLFVGMDISPSPRKCDFNDQVQSLNVQGSYAQPQPATGCFVKNFNGNRHHNIVYVIELDSFAVKDVVSVHLENLETNSSLKIKYVTLVLKCHKPVKWTVSSSEIRGVLQIVAENSVNIQASPLLLTTVVLDRALPSFTSVLLSSVRKSFGPIYTYVKASQANRVNIMLKLKTKALPENASNMNASHEISKEKTSIGDVFLSKDDKSYFDYSIPNDLGEQSLGLLLVKSMTVNCKANQINIAFPLQETLNIFTGAMSAERKLSSITLSDENCKAIQNDTHIILQSSLHGCGTQHTTVGGFHNQVQFITTLYDSKTDLFSETKHLPTDDDDYISEDGSGSVDVSTKEERIIYPLPFQCNPSPGNSNSNAAEKLNLALFSKKNYSQAVTPQQFPLNVVVHDHLFAEATIKADPRLCIIIDECWLSEEPLPSKSARKKNFLIKQGCPTDLSVDILSNSQCGSVNPDVDHYRMRFSFQLSEEFINQQLFLHCRLTSCAMQDSKQLNSKQCIFSENFCLKQSLRPYLDSLRGKKYSMLMQGPIQVISKFRMDRGKEPITVASPESTSPPVNLIADHSFNKLTEHSKKNPISQELIFIGMSTEAVVGIAFASFVIGAGLMATLWLIHMHTEPSRRLKRSRKQTAGHQYTPGTQMNFSENEPSEKIIPRPLKAIQICS